MKKSSVWTLIIGIAIVITSGLNLAQSVSYPTELPDVNIAIAVSDILSILLGIFVLFTFLHQKRKEDANPTAVEPVPNTPEDAVRLGKMRDWIIAFVIFYMISQSASTWILNDYAVVIFSIRIKAR